MAHELKIVISCFNMPRLRLQVPSCQFITAVVKTCEEIKHANEILIMGQDVVLYVYGNPI